MPAAEDIRVGLAKVWIAVALVGDRLDIAGKVVPVHKNEPPRGVDRRRKGSAWRVMEKLKRVGRGIKFPETAHRRQPEVLLSLGQVRLTVVRPVAGKNELAVRGVTGHDVVVGGLVRDFRQNRL